MGRVVAAMVHGRPVTHTDAPANPEVLGLFRKFPRKCAANRPSRLIFDHAAAQAHFGASVFWLRGLAALPNEEESIASWQIKRDGTRRGIVEITEARP